MTNVYNIIKMLNYNEIIAKPIDKYHLYDIIFYREFHEAMILISCGWTP